MHGFVSLSAIKNQLSHLARRHPPSTAIHPVGHHQQMLKVTNSYKTWTWRNPGRFHAPPSNHLWRHVWRDTTQWPTVMNSRIKRSAQVIRTLGFPMLLSASWLSPPTRSASTSCLVRADSQLAFKAWKLSGSTNSESPRLIQDGRMAADRHRSDRHVRLRQPTLNKPHQM